MKTFPLSGLSLALLAIGSVSGVSMATEVQQLKDITVITYEGSDANNLNNASITSLNVEDLGRSTANNARDMFRYTPGLQFSRTAGTGLGDISIRGMGGTGGTHTTGQNYVALNVDGMPLADTFKSGHYQRNTRATFDFSDLKQVDIIKGSGVVGSGKMGLAGTVNFITKDPKDYFQAGRQFGGNVRTGYDSADRSYMLGATLAGGDSDGLSAMLSFTHRKGHELRNKGGEDIISPARTRNNPTDYQSNNVLGKIVWQLNPNHRFSLKLDHYKFDSKQDVLNYDKRYVKTPRSFEDRFDSRRSGLSLRHDFKVDAGIFDSGFWQVYTQQSKQTRASDDTTYLNYGMIFDIETMYKVRNSGLALTLNKQLKSGSVSHRIQYGVNLEHNRTESAQTSNGRTTVYNPKTITKDYNFFISDDIGLMDGRWFITPGIQIGRYQLNPKATDGYDPSKPNQPFESSRRSYVNWELGTRFNLSENHQLFFSYRQGLKGQSFAEMNSRTGHGTALPSPDLKPEKARTFELGLRSQGRLGHQTITAFHSTYRDMIYRASKEVPNPNFGQPRQPRFLTQYFMQNHSGKVVIYGLEYEGRLNLAEAFGAPDGLYVAGAIAYAKGRDRRGKDTEPWSDVDPINGFLRLGFDAPNNTWGVATSLNFARGKKAKDINSKWLEDAEKGSARAGYKVAYLPTGGYATLDVTAYARPLKNLHINAGIYNVTDRKYLTWNDVKSSVSDAVSPFPHGRMTQAGINFGLNMRYEF
ncbi:Vitamin B12 transporter BtuB [Oligella sp. MSHR50489EDL]|uniref:TonB-dependent hemoglobin/transferrin/lactoferrin family receptor n=1 Tax=Oligella sp. MSHR50489EDL TaxID=3139409 RepID=UPI003D8137EC